MAKKECVICELPKDGAKDFYPVSYKVAGKTRKMCKTCAARINRLRRINDEYVRLRQSLTHSISIVENEMGIIRNTISKMDLLYADVLETARKGNTK